MPMAASGFPICRRAMSRSRHDWNLNPASTTTLPNFSGTVLAAVSCRVSSSTKICRGQRVCREHHLLCSCRDQQRDPRWQRSVDSNGNSTNGALAGNGTFTAITEFNAGTPSNPIWIGSANVGFILQLGNDNRLYRHADRAQYLYRRHHNSCRQVDHCRRQFAGRGPQPLQFGVQRQPDVRCRWRPDQRPGGRTGGQRHHFQQSDRGQCNADDRDDHGRTFTTSRPIAVGSEAATIDVNGNTVTLNGPLITLGYDGVGLGVTSGFSPLTIDDLSSGAAGTLVLSTPARIFTATLSSAMWARRPST